MNCQKKPWAEGSRSTLGRCCVPSGSWTDDFVSTCILHKPTGDSRPRRWDRRNQWLGCACDLYIFVPCALIAAFTLGPNAAATNIVAEAGMLHASNGLLDV